MLIFDVILFSYTYFIYALKPLNSANVLAHFPEPPSDADDQIEACDPSIESIRTLQNRAAKLRGLVVTTDLGDRCNGNNASAMFW